MSRVALCLSGQPRFIEENFDSINRHIIEPSGCDVFCHFWNTWDDSKGMDPAKAIDFYKPASFQVQNQIEFEEDEARLFRMKSMFYSVFRSNELRKEFERMTGHRYECVIRCRTDKIFDINFDIAEFDSAPDALWIHNDGLFPCGVRTYSDAFGFGSSENMNKYCGFFNYIDELKSVFESDHAGHRAAPECYFTYYIDHMAKIRDVRTTKMRRILEPHYVRSKS